MTYQQFTDDNEEAFGSFETFFTCGSFDQGAQGALAAGWYWHPCFPGCMPDAEPVGPFNTEEEAINDANEY